MVLVKIVGRSSFKNGNLVGQMRVLVWHRLKGMDQLTDNRFYGSLTHVTQPVRGWGYLGRALHAQDTPIYLRVRNICY
jgi:hypothetical protein